MVTKSAILFLVVCGCLTIAVGSALQASDETAAALVARLASPDEAVRLRAVDELGARGAKAAEAVAPLVQLLKDDSTQVRAHAAHALGKIGAPAKPAVVALAKLLKDSDQTVRRQAIKAIMRIRPGPKVTVPLAIELLSDPDPAVHVRVLHAISEAGPKAVPALIEALKDDKAAYWACLVLRDIGPAAKDAVPALIEKLQDANPEIPQEAILTLAAMGDAAIPALDKIAAALSDQQTRTAATFALGRIGRIPADSEAAVRANVKSDDKMLSTTSLWALARVHPEDKQLRGEVTEKLIARLKESDPFVRAAAARALAELPPAPEITDPIWEKAMRDADATTTHYALDALAQLGPRAVPRLIDSLRHEKLRIYIVPILGRMGHDAAPATEALTALIADKDKHLAHEAVLALANIGPGAKSAVPSLIKLIRQADESNVPAIAYALGKIGPDAAEAKPVLSDLLESPAPHVALASAWALVQIGPVSPEVAAKTLPVLTAGLANDHPVARQGAAEALGRLGPLARNAVPALKKATKDENESVRRAATAALEAIRSGPAQLK